MADDLPAVLTLLHDTGRRWRTLRAEGQDVVDDDRAIEAFRRNVPEGARMGMRGTPGPSERDPHWLVWMRPPDQWRADFGGPHGTRTLVVANGGRECTWLASGRGPRVTERARHRGGLLGPADTLVRPFLLPAAFTLEVVDRWAFLGREIVVVRGRARPDAEVHVSSARGADEVELGLDRERAVLLWLEARLDGAPYRRIAMTSVAFDEALDDDLFAIPAGVDHPPAMPPRPPREPVGRPPSGPPDTVLGRSVGTPVVVARGPSFVVAVDSVLAYPEGFELRLTVRTNGRRVSGSFDHGHRRTWSGTAAFPGESLRVGIVFGDGRRSTAENFPAGLPTRRDVTLAAVHGGGTPQARFDQTFWVAPLPPPGPVGVVVGWEGRALEEARVDLDGGAIADAAARAEVLWG